MKQFMEQDGSFVKPLQVGIQPASPGVAVGFVFDDARLFWCS